MKWRILGPLEVTAGDEPVDLGGPKQRALLAVLLIHANRVVALDQLIDALWGEAPPARATATLQVFISNLRRSLEPDRPPRSPATVLLTRPPGYMLTVEPDNLDSGRFERLARDGRRLLVEGDPSGAHAALTEALNLWQGRALAEFAHEAFAQPEANRLEGLRLLAVEDRVQAGLDLGRHREVVAELETVLADNPLRERLWGMLMLAEYRSGRQADAVRSFQEARRRLAEELGIEPGPALRQLDRDILAQSDAIEWQPVDGAPAPSLRVPPSPRGTAVSDAPGNGYGFPLVGRRAELQAFDRAVTAVSTGTSGVLLLSGEPGIGKTRLCHELASRAAARGAVVAWGHCFEGAATPFWPWVQVLRVVMGASAAGSPAAWESSALGQLLPELEVEAPLSGLSPEPTEARFQLCSAVTGFLLRAARDIPLCIVLDDLHCADPPSLQLLGLLATQMVDASLLVAATYRDTEAGDPTSPLSETLSTLTRESVTRRLPLAGLPVGDVAAFVANATGVPPSPSLAAALHARTEGNPFFLTELVRLLQSERTLRGGNPDRLPDQVPPGVRDVIRRRLARLPEQTNAVLSVGAVAGTQFDHRLLEAVGGLDEERTLELMEVAMVSGIVSEGAGQVGRYRFSHPLVRQTVYEGLSGVRRARLHARVAEALRSLHGDEVVVDIAHHLWLAIDEVGADAALPSVLGAAEVSLAQLAYEEAAEQLRRAGELLRRSGDDPSAARQELAVQLRLAQLLAMTKGSKTPETEGALTRAQALTEIVGHEPEFLPALWGLFFALQLRCEIEPGRRLAEQFRETAARTGEHLFALAGQLGTGIITNLEGDLAASHVAYQEAAAIADTMTHARLLATFQMDPGSLAAGLDAHVLALQGRADDAARLARKAITRATERGDRLGSAVGYICSGMCGVLSEDLATVENSAETAITICGTTGFRGLEALAMALDGWAMARRGRVKEASARARQGLALHTSTGNVWGRSMHVAWWAELERHPARQKAALAAIEESLTAAANGGERYYEAEFHRLRADLLASLFPDRRAEARRSAERAVAVARSQGAAALEARAVATREGLQAAARAPSW